MTIDRNYGCNMDTIPAGEFKIKCLKLMDMVAADRREITITKRGIPVAKIVPIDHPQEPFGVMRGSIKILSDDLSNEKINEKWDAESE